MRDTIDMAKEAGFQVDQGALLRIYLENFAEIVRADEREQYKWDIHSCGPTCKRYACVAMREAVEAEREACAKVCDRYIDSSSDHEAGTAMNIQAAIRARGNT
jgi:hypothetical protein